jgi:hypothetical protein
MIQARTFPQHSRTNPDSTKSADVLNTCGHPDLTVSQSQGLGRRGPIPLGTRCVSYPFIFPRTT